MYIYTHIYIYDQLGYTYILHTLYIYIYIIYNIYIYYIYIIYIGITVYLVYVDILNTCLPPPNYCFQGLPFTISLRYATTISTCL